VRPETATWVANIRAEAADPSTVLVIVSGKTGRVAIFPDEIVGKSDDELLDFIAKRLAE
jgi:hypothetical protein